MFEKWDRNIEKRLVFLCSSKILAIFGIISINGGSRKMATPTSAKNTANRQYRITYYGRMPDPLFQFLECPVW